MNSDKKPIAAWLLICCALVFAMVVVGGVTRLTDSGLSIVEWQPLIGTVPPITQEDWDELLEKYRSSPQYQQINKGMSVDEFKTIFWWEYFHRLLGRLIGLVFFIPFIYFLVTKKIDKPLGYKLAGIFVLGGLQGFMGWYMVMSGLVDNPRVSQYRLTAHLGLAFIIFAALFWVALGILSPNANTAAANQNTDALKGLRRFAYGLSWLIFIMVLSGGFVAGIRAGLAYNTFPLMNGHLVPPDLFVLEPWYRNFFENMTTVQFNHRLIAWVLIFSVPLLWFKAIFKSNLSGTTRLACHAFLLMLAIQVSLGITTLLHAVPINLAATHQGGAVLLFAASLWVSHQFRKPG